MDRAKMEINPPHDRFKLIFFILLLQGIGTLTPWNMFINAKPVIIHHSLRQRIDSKDPFSILLLHACACVCVCARLFRYSISSTTNWAIITQMLNRNTIQISSLTLVSLHKFQMYSSIGSIYSWIWGTTWTYPLHIIMRAEFDFIFLFLYFSVEAWRPESCGVL